MKKRRSPLAPARWSGGAAAPAFAMPDVDVPCQVVPSRAVARFRRCARVVSPRPASRPRAGVEALGPVLAFEQCSDLGLAEPPMATRCADAADPTGRGPARHSLGIDAEQRGHFARRE